ncbi:MAG: hypothetical protein HYV53_03580, partial [Parcubacteria group bacterium]|nr:hypothetical protein [Parcubacteria group bacterium]
MRRLPSDSYKKLMPLKRIAEASSYSFGYVSILVQRKKLKAKKIGNKYYSTQEWFDQYLELHARDEKRLSPAAARGLSSDQVSEQSASEAIASARLKNRIDNLVEQALKDKLVGPAMVLEDSQIEKKDIKNWIAGQARNDNTAEWIAGSAVAEALADKQDRNDQVVVEKDLAGVLNDKIFSPEAMLFADLIEPEKKLAVVWSSSLKREEKDLKAAVKEITKSVKTKKEKIVVASKFEIKVVRKKIFGALKSFWIPARPTVSFGRACAGMMRGIMVVARMAELLAMTIAVWRGLVAKLSVYFEKINCRLGNCGKIVKRHPLTFKTLATSAIIYLAIFSFTNLAPSAAAELSLTAGRGFSRAAGQIKGLARAAAHSEYLFQLSRPFEKVKELAGRPEVIVPGKVLSSKIKISLADQLTGLTGRSEAASLKLENNLKQRNRVLVRRLAAVKAQAFFITDFWSGQLNAPVANIKLAARFLPARTARLGGEMITALRGFLNYQDESVNETDKSPRPPFVKGSKKQGRVAGAAEASVEPLFMPRLLALANTTSRRGQEAINQAKDNAAATLVNTAGRQKELSLSFGKKLAKLTLASAKGLGLISRNGQQKLAGLENTISQTNQSAQAYNNSGAKYLVSEAGRSLWSLGNIYAKIIDRLVPDSLKNKYARLYLPAGQAGEQPPVVVEKEVVVKEKTTIVKERPAVKAGQKAVARPDSIGRSAPSRMTDSNLSITGNAAIGGELNVSGPAKFKNKLTVLGQANFEADVTVAAALTAKTLLVTDYAQFAGPINAKDLTADNLTSRNNLTVVGGSFIGGNELVSGNLKVAGTLQAGHTEFSSLGVTGQLGAQSLSAGLGGLAVSGNVHLNGDSNIITGNVALNNILNINKETPAALTVGDGLANNFIVNTKDDVITIAATLNLSGNTQYAGNLDLNGVLDLDTASTSALTVGDGTADNFKVDTVNDIITLGYSSTTDQININAKQIALNSASTTTVLLVNYDGTGNIVQILDNGVNRFNLADNGNIIQTASTTGYAYVLNQAGTGGGLLDVQDQGASRFSIADLGITSLIASSTTGTALSIRQDSTGDILNLFDGANEVLTVLDGGNVGIGTTSPLAKLSIQGAAGANVLEVASSTGQSLLTVNNTGQCVTGDTLLSVIPASEPPRKMRGGLRVKPAMTKPVRIDQIKGGEYVLSLNETSGKLEPHQIVGLLDMGVKPIYKITTASGKTIRTTENHPYLTKQGWQKVANLAEGEEIAVAKEELEIFGMMKKNQTKKNQQNYTHNNIENKIAHNNLFIAAVSYNNIADNENNTYYNVGDKKIVHNFELGSNLSPISRVNIAKIIPKEKVSRLKSLPAIPGAKIETKVEPTSNFDRSIKYSEIFSNWDSVNFINNSNYSNSSDGVSNENAVTDVEFVRIISIELLPPEQVYDIEVEGTHNFVGNGIIAHNTYIYGNVGIGTTSPGQLLSVAGNGLFNGNITAYGGFTGASITATSSLTISASDTASSSVNNLLTLEHLSSASGGLAGLGSAILFNAEDTGGSSTSTARILSALSNVSTSSPASYLAFETKNTTGALTERLRIISDGSLGIGTTSPLAKLSVQGTAGANVFDVASSTGQSLLTVNNTGQCVTGDTKLRRRRRRKKKGGG